MGSKTLNISLKEANIKRRVVTLNGSTVASGRRKGGNCSGTVVGRGSERVRERQEEFSERKNCLKIRGLTSRKKKK